MSRLGVQRRGALVQLLHGQDASIARDLAAHLTPDALHTAASLALAEVISKLNRPLS